jgi:hypothetical protein
MALPAIIHPFRLRASEQAFPQPDAFRQAVVLAIANGSMRARTPFRLAALANLLHKREGLNQAFASPLVGEAVRHSRTEGGAQLGN